MKNHFWKETYRRTGERFGISVDNYQTEAQWEQRFTTEARRIKKEKMKNDPEFAEMIYRIEGIK